MARPSRSRQEQTVKRKLVITAGAALALVALATAILVISAHRRLTVDLPALRSDVPVLGADEPWGPAVTLRIDAVEARVVFAVLNLFNGRAVVEFRLRGTMQGRPGERPALTAVRIVRQRLEQARAHIALFPVIEVEPDPAQPSVALPFDTRVQVELGTLAFGINRFTVTAGEQRADFDLHQGK